MRMYYSGRTLVLTGPIKGKWGGNNKTERDNIGNANILKQRMQSNKKQKQNAESTHFEKAKNSIECSLTVYLVMRGLGLRCCGVMCLFGMFVAAFA
jgi:hypothetical protein